MNSCSFGLRVSARATLLLAGLASFDCGGGNAGPVPGAAAPGAAPGDGCGDKNLTNVAIPNATIGDAGVTVAECYTCMLNACQSQLAACNLDCQCNPGVASIPGCLATGSDKIGECAAGLQGNVAGGGVLGCLEQDCIRTCSGLPGGG
jgi:hypothetical protein